MVAIPRRYQAAHTPSLGPLCCTFKPTKARRTVVCVHCGLPQYDAIHSLRMKRACHDYTEMRKRAERSWERFKRLRDAAEFLLNEGIECLGEGRCSKRDPCGVCRVRKALIK